MTDFFVTANSFDVDDIPATTLTGQTVAAIPASFSLGPRHIVGVKAAQWRRHPRTTSGRVIKAR
jgi:hypothetical protein